MNEEKKDSEVNDRDPTIIYYEDKEIKEQEPPNDKIVHFKIVKNQKNSEYLQN